MYKVISRALPILFLFLTVLFFGFRQILFLSAEPEKNNPINVLHYTLSLDILDFTSKQIQGTADLQILSEKDGLKEFYLDLTSLEVDSVWIEEDRVRKIDHNGQKLRISLFDPLDKGSTTLVTIFYHGTPAKDPAWGGFYFNDKFAYNMGVGMKSDPHPFGRAWYPCIDSFTDRASYSYFITVADGKTAVCPGTLVEVLKNENNTQTFHWELNSTIPTYLSSVAVSDYICIQDTFQGIEKQIPSMIFVSPKDSLNAVACFRDLKKWLDCFENLFGPYRWEKIGYVSVPFSGGAMEHATSISISERTLADSNGFKGILVHEFAHNWFGNLVTCSTPDDMWLNEGWATYAVALYKECFSTKESFEDAVMANHNNVLRIAHIRDDGYKPVFGNSPEHTYGSTVYNKGFDVAHILRGYIGDDRFFQGLKEYFEKYAFSDIGSQEFLDFMSEKTETNLENFSKSWVYSPGFPHYSIDSFFVEKTGEKYSTTVFIRQKLLGTDRYHENEKLDITFLSGKWESFEAEVLVSDSLDEETFIVPFEPNIVVLDPNYKVLDATTREAKTINEVGAYSFRYAGLTLDVNSIEDSSFLHMSKNWIEPDRVEETAPSLLLDHTGYWTVQGLNLKGLDATASFEYENFKYYGNDFIRNVVEKNLLNSVILIYRQDAGYSWKEIPFKHIHSITSGKFIVNEIKKGEYCLALKK